MPLSTFNYYAVLGEMNTNEQADEFKKGIIPSKKWKKKKVIFEERAHEWTPNDEAVPLSNKFAVLAGIVSDSSEEDDHF